MTHQTSGRSYSTHGAFNRCQVARQQWVWSKVTTQCVSCHLHAGTQAGGEYLAFFSGCSQAATRRAMMKRALKVPHGVVVDRCQHIPPRLHRHATRRGVGHAAESTHGPGGPILLTDHCRCRFCCRCLPTLHVQRMSGRTAPPSALSGKSRTWNGRRAPASALAGEAVSANGMHWCGARRRQRRRCWPARSPWHQPAHRKQRRTRGSSSGPQHPN